MSLINDALKKARDNKPSDAKAADGPSLRPVEAQPGSASAKRTSVNLLLALLSTVVLGLAILFFAQWYGASTDEVKARANSKPWQVTDITKPKVPPVVHVPNPTLPAGAPASDGSGAPGKTSNLIIPSALERAATNLASMDPLKKVEIKYKLQSIIYRPGNATVLINGRTAGLGERVLGALVTDIQPESVTIVTPAGETILMELR